jgi:sensor histidine kinase regulating citrate/malate metabolism
MSRGPAAANARHRARHGPAGARPFSSSSARLRRRCTLGIRGCRAGEFSRRGEKITWAVATLIGNALRHFQREHEPNTKPRISIVVDYEFETSELLIRVVDNGPGIPSDRKRWLFEQNPQTGQATGLALVMVKDVVLAHNGSVEVESRAGVGTAITLRLPRA